MRAGCTMLAATHDRKRVLVDLRSFVAAIAGSACPWSRVF